jgi:prevent-host-death family protein
MAERVVGARELKVRLGRYLRRVRQGQRLVVTDRGEPVAELRPIGGIARPSRKKLTAFRPIESRGGALSTAVGADRDDRF